MDHIAVGKSLLDQSWGWCRSLPLSSVSNFPKKSAPKVQPTAPSTFRYISLSQFFFKTWTPPQHPGPLTRVFPFFMSTSLSKTAAKFGSSDSTDQMGGTAGYDSWGEKSGESSQGGQLWEMLDFACPPLPKSSSPFALP